MKGISFGIVTLLCFVLLASLQSAEPWKRLLTHSFSGQALAVKRVTEAGIKPS